MKSKTIILSFTVIFLCMSIEINASSTCAIYFTGIGCPHCARTDPVVLGQLPLENKNLRIIEYEIYQNQENAPLLVQYNSEYNLSMGVPLIIFSKENYIIGDTPILENIRSVLNSTKSSNCLLAYGDVKRFEDIDFEKLPGSPKIWAKDRVLIKNPEGKTDNEILHKLIETDNIQLELNKTGYKKIRPKVVQLSGRKLYFKNAAEVGGWTIEWERTNNKNQRNFTYVYIGIALLGASLLGYLFIKRKR